jgi:hypothetical protein
MDVADDTADIVVLNVGVLCLVSGTTERGMEWLADHAGNETPVFDNSAALPRYHTSWEGAGGGRIVGRGSIGPQHEMTATR